MHVPEAKVNMSKPKIMRPMANMAGICRTDRRNKQPTRALSTLYFGVPLLAIEGILLKVIRQFCWWEWGYDLATSDCQSNLVLMLGPVLPIKIQGNYDSVLT